MIAVARGRHVIFKGQFSNITRLANKKTRLVRTNRVKISYFDHELQKANYFNVFTVERSLLLHVLPTASRIPQ